MLSLDTVGKCFVIGLCAVVVGGCVVPFERHLDASAAGYFVHNPDRNEKRDEKRSAPWAVEGAISGGVGLGCRGRDWSPFLHGGLAGGYDGALNEAYGAFRLGAGYRHELGAFLLETSAAAGPVMSGWGYGGGGVLAAGFGLLVGSVDEGLKYGTMDYLMIEAVVDVRTLQQLNDAFVTQRKTQVFFGIRVRSLRRWVPPCYGPSQARSAPIPRREGFRDGD